MRVGNRTKRWYNALMSTIAQNKKAGFNYAFEESFEAGMVLEGWEVKSIRAGKIQITDGYVHIKDCELFMVGCQVTPLSQASTHQTHDSLRTKKLLMKKDDIRRLVGKIERKGYTLVPTALYWKNNKVKCEIGLAKGKKQHDKRETEKNREWEREKQRLMKHNVR